MEGTRVPQLSRWLVRTALGYLLVALMIGAAGPWFGTTFVVWPTYVHLLVLGWLTQLIFGVAYWMFPRQHGAFSAWKEAVGWGAYLSLNLGLVLRAIVESRPSDTGGEWFVISALLQLAAGWALIALIWPRVRAR
jgi:hypothetical protein